MAGNDALRGRDAQEDDPRRPSSDVSRSVPVPIRPAPAGGSGLSGFMMDYLDCPNEWGNVLDLWEQTQREKADRSAGHDSMQTAGSDSSRLIISDSDESPPAGRAINRFVENKAAKDEQHHVTRCSVGPPLQATEPAAQGHTVSESKGVVSDSLVFDSVPYSGIVPAKVTRPAGCGREDRQAEPASTTGRPKRGAAKGGGVESESVSTV